MNFYVLCVSSHTQEVKRREKAENDGLYKNQGFFLFIIKVKQTKKGLNNKQIYVCLFTRLSNKVLF